MASNEAGQYVNLQRRTAPAAAPLSGMPSWSGHLLSIGVMSSSAAPGGNPFFAIRRQAELDALGAGRRYLNARLG